MSNKAMSKAVTRARAMGLAIKTDLPFKTEFPLEDDAPSFAGTASAGPVHSTFGLSGTIEKTSTRKKSEAMLNPDWRNVRRSQFEISESFEPCITAPPAKTEFTKEEIEMPKKKFSIDGEAANAWGPRRYRETPVDPDYILSAPATKLEFDHAIKETNPTLIELSDDERDNSDSVTESDEIKSLIRLEAISPTTREGFENVLIWTKPEDHARSGTGSFPSSVAVTPLEFSKDDCDVEYPMAEIRAVKGAQRFEPDPQAWTKISRRVQKTLEMLVEPRTAGLPVEKLRANYDEGQKALALAMEQGLGERAFKLRDGDHLGVDVADSTQVHGEELRMNRFIGRLQTPREENRFHALLGKLRKSADTRVPLHDVPENAVKQPTDTKATPVVQLQEVEKKGTTLNPNASEFFSVKENAQPITFHSPPPKSTGTPLPGSGEVIPDRLPTSSDLHELENQVKSLTEFCKMAFAKLASHSARIGEQDVNYGAATQLSGVSANAFGSTRSAMPIVKDTFALAPTKKLGYNHVSLNQTAPPHPTGCQSPYVVTAYTSGSSNVSANSMTPAHGTYQNQYGCSQNSYHNYAHAQSNTQSNGGAQITQIPTTSSQDSSGTSSYASIAPAQYGRVPMTGPVVPPVDGFTPAAGPAPFYAPAPFGPKPVRKPKGPGNSTQQQEYEAYLEYRRQTDPAYAVQAKQRQARRAERLHRTA